jgi:hypothetical protein
MILLSPMGFELHHKSEWRERKKGGRRTEVESLVITLVIILRSNR